MNWTADENQDLAPLPQGMRSTGVRRSRRPQQPWQFDEFRILSIDGGGIRGILPATILELCERNFLGGGSAGRCFDMITGTSTGGIIALGLGRGKTAAEILQLYTDHGGEIFPQVPDAKGLASIWRRSVKIGRDVRRVRYSPRALTEHLEKTFGGDVYGESERRLVIPTFDAHTKINVLKTPHHPDFRIDWQNRMVDVALATSAAPTYLPPHRIGTQVYADGGVWANNPVMLGLVDALTCYDLDRHKVRILSLGCGSGELRFTEKQMVRGGQWDWRNLVSTAMDLSSQSADGQARLLVGADRFCRLDLPDQVHPIPLDDFETAMKLLPQEGERLFQQNQQQLASFFEGPRPTYEAHYGPRVAAP
ncbi:CBASS cGAMP-activated phospholipase [Aureimonas phyllosphaerae]|uniref:CBASS cGAMP-activated phospholipase n=1 Tax=Aureimonas phyllosphaerae TaxID=1166078 RepID=UPI003A5BE9EE